MNHAEWLAKNSIDCQPLGARISLTQCQANHGHTYACEDCPHGGVKYVGPPKVTKKARDKTAPVIAETFMTPEPVLPVLNTQINVVDTQKHEPTEETMAEKKSYVYRGTCATCKRPDLKLSKNGGDCGRCAWRRKNGQDPLAADLRNAAKNKVKAAPETAQGPTTPPDAATPPPGPEKGRPGPGRPRNLHYRCHPGVGRHVGGKAGRHGAAVKRLKKHLLPAGAGACLCRAHQLNGGLTWAA